MTRLRTIALLLAFAFVAVGSGCTTTHNDPRNDDYYRRGSIHRESFPPNYVPGRHRSWGSYGRYGW